MKYAPGCLSRPALLGVVAVVMFNAQKAGGR